MTTYKHIIQRKSTQLASSRQMLSLTVLSAVRLVEEIVMLHALIARGQCCIVTLSTGLFTAIWAIANEIVATVTHDTSYVPPVASQSLIIRADILEGILC